MERCGVEEFVPLAELAVYKPATPEMIEKLTDHGPTGKMVIPEDFDPSLLTDVVDNREVTRPDGSPVVGPEFEADSSITIAPDGTIEPTAGNAIEIDADGQDATVVPTKPDPQPSEADQIRNYLADHGTGTPNKEVVKAFEAKGIKITSQQVSNAKAELKAKAKLSGESEAA